MSGETQPIATISSASGHVAAEVLAVKESQVVLEADFAEDLDADSLDIVELVMTLEEEFDIEINEEELEGVTTVSAAFELITSKL